MDHPTTKLFAEVAAGDDCRFSLSQCIWRYVLSLTFYYRLLLASPRRVALALLTEAPAFARRAPLPLQLLCAALFPLLFVISALLFTLRPAWCPDLAILHTSSARIDEAALQGGLTRFVHALCFQQLFVLANFFAEPKKNHLHWSKTYWRKVLSGFGAFVPPQIGRYDCAKQSIAWERELAPNDVVIKAEIGSLGKGDCFLEFGQDFRTRQELEQKLSDHMKQQPADVLKQHSMLLLERVLPDEDLGVHNFEIISGRARDGSIFVAHVALYHGTSHVSSHQCKSCYLVDPLTQKVQGPEQWALRPATWPVDPAMLGRHLPQLREACELAVKMHAWILAQGGSKGAAMPFIGWDCMLKKDGGFVWFEGNPCNLRLARFMCSSWASLKAFRSLHGDLS